MSRKVQYGARRLSGRNPAAQHERDDMEITNATVGDTPQLEIALLRRGLDGRQRQVEHCHGCNRDVLIGERIYEYESGELLCALCRSRARKDPIDSHRVHGPAFGHSIRVVDRRAA